jgi:hypothetical protein
MGELLDCDELICKGRKPDFNYRTSVNQFGEGNELNMRSLTSSKRQGGTLLAPEQSSSFARRCGASRPNSPNFVFDMDETSTAINREVKRMTSAVSDQTFDEIPKTRSLMTVVVCRNVAGWTMRPLVVLSALQHLPRELETFQTTCCFATQQSALMTNDLFAL